MGKAKTPGNGFPHFGAYLKAKRLEAKLTQVEVAEELGFLSPQFVSSVETGKKHLPLNKLDIIAILYQIPKSELVQAMREEQLRIFHERLKKSVSPK